MLYLDHAATTPVRPEALKAAWPYLTDEFGNPSSVHEAGLRAKAALDWARQTVATELGALPDEIVFTSGGTEANNLAIKGIALGQPRGRHIVSAGTEHSSVLACLEYLERVHGFEVTLLPVDAEGRISATDLRAALRPNTTLVTLMLANNEIGTAHDITQLAAVAKEFDVPFHTDAVQAAGWFDLNVKELGVQALSLSGHKFGAPKGSGLLYVSSGLQLEPVIHGGGQEGGLRSGTQNVAWAVAAAVALQLTNTGKFVAISTDDAPATGNTGGRSSRTAMARAVTSAFIDGVLSVVPRARLTGTTADSGERHPAIASFTFEGLNGETLLLELEQAGVICSSGSACSAGSTEPSHVLITMGLDADICRTVVRFSFGHDANSDQATQALVALKKAVAKVSGL